LVGGGAPRALAGKVASPAGELGLTSCGPGSADRAMHVHGGIGCSRHKPFALGEAPRRRVAAEFTTARMLGRPEAICQRDVASWPRVAV